MSKLSTKAATEIASLINSIEVAGSMIDKALAALKIGPDAEAQKRLSVWADSRSEAVVMLADRFGIQMVTLESDRTAIAVRNARREAASRAIREQRHGY
jgi:hypothetical protein